MAILLLPIMILNFFAGIVGGIWLVIEGEWAIIGIGLGVAIGGTLLASILMLPGIILALPAAAAAERGSNVFAAIFGSLSLIYTYFIMAVWAISIFYFFINESDNLIPILLWSYSTSTVTWSYMAQKEASVNEYSSISSFFHQLGCIGLMIYGYNNYFSNDLADMIYWYAIPISFGAIFSIFTAFANSKQTYR